MCVNARALLVLPSLFISCMSNCEHAGRKEHHTMIRLSLSVVLVVCRVSCSRKEKRCICECVWSYQTNIRMGYGAGTYSGIIKGNKKEKIFTKNFTEIISFIYYFVDVFIAVLTKHLCKSFRVELYVLS